MNTEERRTTSNTILAGWTCSGLLTAKDAANLRRFNIWLMSSALCFAGSIIAISADLTPGPIGYLLTAATFLLGVGAMRVYVRFLREADELLRKIQLEALAIGFGGGVILMLTWVLLEELGAPEISGAMFASVMLIFWAIGQRIGMARYAEGDR